MSDLTALVLNCTLKRGSEESSSDLLGTQILAALAEHGVQGQMKRVIDEDVRFGVTTDEGDGDGWPALRALMLEAEILVIVTPIWLGQASAVCKMVLERLDAELSETDEQGRLLTYGKVAGLGVVGNEDGAHHVTAQVFQALNDVGFTIAASSATYWVGQAMQAVDYKDLDSTPEETATTNKTLAAHVAHLARVLRDAPYPPVG